MTPLLVYDLLQDNLNREYYIVEADNYVVSTITELNKQIFLRNITNVHRIWYIWVYLNKWFCYKPI